MCVLGLDPVDCAPPFNKISPRYPSSISALAETSAEMAFVGSEFGYKKTLGVACAPAECNYQKFFANSTEESWMLKVRGAGHQQFLDDRKGAGTAPSLCFSGSQDDQVAGDITKTTVVAWAEHTMRGKDIGVYTGTWSQGLVDEGKINSEYHAGEKSSN